ncbi:hypothetical protein SEA_FINKLE_33 [Gordonia phage Finkle]|uniref:Uncharacterized protein n=1 Tax=Gordonia phage Finkle TaxID=2926099 RepID=A0A9E7NIP0_9CAUD|nr:hypothetical protein QEH33_gp33 [Gordonia phage Finkle]UTN92952.1 hypothetical protein SEA_FINKLE_33 [Gordonia phage Finkle]
MSHLSNPKGPGETWKTGQRVPFAGHYEDQYGIVSYHEAHATFPPCIDRKGEAAFRRPVSRLSATS